MMPANVLVLSMLAIGSSFVLLGTSTGTILVYDGYQQKSCSHSLATLSDSVLALCHVKGRGESPPPYVFAGLANGQVVVFDQCVIQNPNATPSTILHLGRGPVKKMKRYRHRLFVISGMEVIAINLSTLEVSLRWIACTDTSLRYLDCLEVGGDMVWTSAHNSTALQLWDAEDGNLRKTINTYNCLRLLDHSTGGGGRGSRSPPSPSAQSLHRYRVKSMLLQMSTNPLLWVGLAAGYLLVIDPTTCLPLMVTHRHLNSIRDIHIMRHLGQGSSTSVVLTCGFGFRTRPGHEAESDSQMDKYGVLVVWDSALPRIKSVLDEIRKEQAPFK